MSIKAKWDKFHFEGSDTHLHIWVFAEGRMYVINEAAHARNKHENINNKTFYEGTIIKKEQRSAQ